MHLSEMPCVTKIQYAECGITLAFLKESVYYKNKHANRSEITSQVHIVSSIGLFFSEKLIFGDYFLNNILGVCITAENVLLCSPIILRFPLYVSVKLCLLAVYLVKTLNDSRNKT